LSPAGVGPHLGWQRREGPRIAAHQFGRQWIDLTRTGCAGVGIVITRRQRCMVVGINWRRRRISRKWIIPRRRVCLRGVVLRKALAPQSSKANQKTRDDNCRAERHPLPPHTSIDVQRGTFKDAAVKSLTSLSVGTCLPLAPLGIGLTIANSQLIGWLAPTRCGISGARDGTRPSLRTSLGAPTCMIDSGNDERATSASIQLHLLSRLQSASAGAIPHIARTK